MINNSKIKILNLIIIIIFAILIFNFTIDKDWFEKINPVLTEYNRVKVVYDNMSQNIKKKNYIENKNIELKNEINKLNVKTVRQEDIIKSLYLYSVKNNIEIEKIDFSEASPVASDNYNTEMTSENQIIQISINFKGSLNNALGLIDDIKNDKTDTAITHVHLLYWSEDVFFVVIDLNFYVISTDV